MTYAEAVKIILNREDKEQIFKQPLYLCSFLADFIGGNLSQKHFLDVLTSLIKDEDPASLLDEKELTRIANKNMFYPKEDVFQALSPFVKKNSSIAARMPKEAPIHFSSDVILLNRRREIFLGDARIMSLDIPSGDITIVNSGADPASRNKSCFTIYGNGNDLPNDALIFQKDSNGELYLSFQADALKKVKKRSFLFEIALNSIQVLSVKTNGAVKANCTLDTLQIEAAGEVVLEGNYTNASVLTSGNVKNRASVVCMSTVIY